MAGGPLLPTVIAFTLQLMQSSPVTTSLQFNVPEVVPTGTMKLQLTAQANATAGVVAFQIADSAITPNIAPSSAAFTTETVATATFSLVNGFVNTKVALTATPTSNQLLLANVTFLTSSTLAQASTWQATLIWE